MTKRNEATEKSSEKTTEKAKNIRHYTLLTDHTEDGVRHAKGDTIELTIDRAKVLQAHGIGLKLV